MTPVVLRFAGSAQKLAWQSTYAACKSCSGQFGVLMIHGCAAASYSGFARPSKQGMGIGWNWMGIGFIESH